MNTPPNFPPFVLPLLISTIIVLPASADEYRVTEGLQALYDFRGNGPMVKDVSGIGSPVNLRIESPHTVTRHEGVLELTEAVSIRSVESAKRISRAVRNSNAVTLEAWFQSANTTQSGPARLLTISKDSSNRNVTLGQDGGRFEVRLRTSGTSTNGIPAVPTEKDTVNTDLTHLVYTRSAAGKARIYINGRVVVDRKVSGNMKNWDLSYGLAIGDEFSGGRSWAGRLHLIAVYSRALSSDHVKKNFDAGPKGRPSPHELAERRRIKAARHFETSVAPILAKHCLECHDSAKHAGDLNLAQKATAFRGGENGPVIVPGKPEDSDLWISVESDAMPHERAPLSDSEKEALRQWIAEGAVWSLKEIDPAIYVHGSRNQNFLQRLTVSEYIETVRSTFGIDVSDDARRILPADLRADGFSNTAYNLNVDLKHVGAYARLADLVVSRLDVDRFVKRFSSRRRFTDKDMEDVISKMGRWILRGPVSRDEVISYRGITTTVASAGGTFSEAMALVIEAMMQSPRFMYRVEHQIGDGSQVAADDYELASRLSYILWGGPPDETLMKAAEAGGLAKDVGEHAKRMLRDPRARQQSQRFVTDWLNLGRLSNLRPNRQRFPDWSPELANDMKAETIAYFDEVVWEQNQPLASLMNSQVTFASVRLAEFYGLESTATAMKPEAADQEFLVTSATDSMGQFKKYDLGKVKGRGGLLTQGSVLTVGGDDASMVTRGLLVLHELLRGVVNDPPPCVDTTPVPTKPGLTQRSIAMERISNATCGGCHSRFEPLAFGLEKFDGIGAYHEKDEHGNPLRDDGEILIPGTGSPVQYGSSAELMDFLAASDRVSQSLTWKVTQFAMGRPLVAEDAATVDRIHEQAMANGGTWPAVVKAIVTSDLVLRTRTESPAQK